MLSEALREVRRLVVNRTETSPMTSWTVRRTTHIREECQLQGLRTYEDYVQDSPLHLAEDAYESEDRSFESCRARLNVRIKFEWVPG